MAASLVGKALQEEELASLEHYVYKSCPPTPFERNILVPFWNKAVEFLPMWLAPNLVTMVGIVPMWLSAVILMMAPSYDFPYEGWKIVFYGVSILWYTTMDALDGKQARRTGTSSPFGQVFDHGIDATTIIPYSVGGLAMFIGTPSPRVEYEALAIQLVNHAAIFSATWQEHHTGTMPTSIGPVGVSEIGWGNALLAIGIGLAGPVNLKAIMASPVPGSGGDLLFQDFAAFGWVAFALVLLVSSMVKTFREAKDKWQAFKDILPMALFIAFSLIWSHECLAGHGKLICVFLQFYSMLFIVPMIISSMAHKEYISTTPAVFPYSVFVLACRLPEVRPWVGVLVPGFCILMVVLVSCWLFVVCRQILKKLNLSLFTIPAKRT